MEAFNGDLWDDLRPFLIRQEQRSHMTVAMAERLLTYELAAW